MPNDRILFMQGAKDVRLGVRGEGGGESLNNGLSLAIVMTNFYLKAYYVQNSLLKLHLFINIY